MFERHFIGDVCTATPSLGNVPEEPFLVAGATDLVAFLIPTQRPASEMRQVPITGPDAWWFNPPFTDSAEQVAAMKQKLNFFVNVCNQTDAAPAVSLMFAELNLIVIDCSQQTKQQRLDEAMRNPPEARSEVPMLGLPDRLLPTSYIGKIVFIESPLSVEGASGEWLILNESDNSLYGIQLGGKKCLADLVRISMEEIDGMQNKILSVRDNTEEAQYVMYQLERMFLDIERSKQYDDWYLAASFNMFLLMSIFGDHTGSQSKTPLMPLADALALDWNPLDEDELELAEDDEDDDDATWVDDESAVVIGPFRNLFV